MNQIRCYNVEGDEVHVIENVPDTSLKSVLMDLNLDGYYTVFVINSFGQELFAA